MADLVLSVCAVADVATVILNRKTNVFISLLFLLYFLCYLLNAFCQTPRNLISIARVKLNVSHSCQWMGLRLSSRLNTHAIDARNFSQWRKKKTNKLLFNNKARQCNRYLMCDRMCFVCIVDIFSLFCLWLVWETNQ